MNYLLNWLQTHFRLVSFRNGEALIFCPSCGKDKLYFNTNKKIGYCHSASCQFHLRAVTIENLTSACGFAPDEQMFISPYPGLKWSLPDTPPTKVTLPENSQPLLSQVDGVLYTIYPIAVNHITTRICNRGDIYKYNFHFDGLRVYIPIYFNGEMVQWIGRAAWWFRHDEKKYKYATGAPVTNYLFNWDSNKECKRLSLVENTFVSIAMNYFEGKDGLALRHGYSSTFGSNLTDAQIKLIGSSKAMTVILVFDRDALGKATRGLQKLRDLGIRAGLLKLGLKQPDDYTPVILGTALAYTHNCLENENKWVFHIDENGRVHDSEL